MIRAAIGPTVPAVRVAVLAGQPAGSGSGAGGAGPCCRALARGPAAGAGWAGGSGGTPRSGAHSVLMRHSGRYPC